MAQIYETFLRWLTLWLPEDSRMYFHLTESSYESLDGEFWMAIAPDKAASSPWELRDWSDFFFDSGKPMTQLKMFGHYFDPNDPYAFD